MFTADNFIVQERAVESGLGAMVLPDLQARLMPALTRVCLKPDVEKRLPMARVFIVVSKATWNSPRGKAVGECFLDWLAELSSEPVERAEDGT